MYPRVALNIPDKNIIRSVDDSIFSDCFEKKSTNTNETSLKTLSNRLNFSNSNKVRIIDMLNTQCSNE